MAPLGVWILYLAGTVGAVLVITQSHIMRHVRALYPPLLGCAQCFGVWAGWACGLALVLRPEATDSTAQRVVEAAACGGVVSALSFSVFIVLRYLGPQSFEHPPSHGGSP